MAFLFLISFSTFGQNLGKVALKGTVTNADHQALPWATVTLKDASVGTLTDENGRFNLPNLPYGSHELTISFIGYKSLTKTVELNAASRNTSLEFMLTENVENLDDVVVNGKTREARLETRGYAMDVIEVNEVKYQSVQANDLLDRSAGVRIRQSGGLGSRINYNINGLSGNSIRIFIDGIPMENYGPSFSLSSIPTNMIERIEVYKGVVPASLGNDALGGAINIILDNSVQNTLNLSYSYGSFNTHTANVNGNYHDEKSGFTMNGSAFYNYSDNNYKVWGKEVYLTDIRTGEIEYITAERFHDSYESRGAKLDAGFTDLGWADKIFVGAVLSDLDREIQHGATMEAVYGNRRAEQATAMINGSYEKTDFLTRGFDVAVFGSYSNLTRKTIDTVPLKYNWRGELTPDVFNLSEGEWLEHFQGAEAGIPSLNESLEKTYTGRVNAVYRINKQNVLSANFLVQDFNRKPDDPLRPAAERALIDTRYATKQVLGITYELTAFQEKFRSSVFLKQYHQRVKLKDVTRRFSSSPEAYEYERETDKTGYGIALSYAVTPQFQLMASSEIAIRLPENQEIFGNATENVDPAFELQPEESLNVNLGINVGPFYRGGHNVRLNSNLFYRDVTGMIRQGVPDQNSETYQFENQEAVLSTGVDMELRYSYNRKFNMTVGSSIFNARFNKEFDQNGDRFIYYQDRLRNEPYFTFNTNMRYNLIDGPVEKAKASVYYNLGYVHEFFRDWESLGSSGKDIIPSQFVNDIGVVYTFPGSNFTVSVDARNIFNEQVFDNWALQKPGRAFYAKINYTIR